MGIDMWSFGCILAELYSGYPIFPGENEMDQLGLIMEICGAPPAHILDVASRRKLFYDDEYHPALKPNSRGKLRKPLTKTLSGVLRCNDKNFLNFLTACFEWDPEDRIKSDEALKHDWILEGLPPKVL